jgi:hypothetical protein
MRFQLALALFFFFPIAGHLQAIVGKVYVTSSDVITVYGLDKKGNLDSNARFSVSNKTKFSVVGFDDNNNIKVTFWRYYTPASNTAKNNKSSTPFIYQKDTLTKKTYWSYSDDLQFIGKWANYKQFAIKPSEFDAACKEYFGTKKDFTWGVMTLPIKARFGNGDDKLFDFEERLNLGFVFGLRKQLKGYVEQSLNYLMGFGITSAKTDSSSMKDLAYYDGSSSLALSLHTGILYQYDNFQVGIFLGADFVPGRVGREWRHQGKPWIGLALGVSLFSKNQTGGGTGENK